LKINNMDKKKELINEIELAKKEFYSKYGIKEIK
jgi:hypothetical protein